MCGSFWVFYCLDEIRSKNSIFFVLTERSPRLRTLQRRKALSPRGTVTLTAVLFSNGFSVSLCNSSKLAYCWPNPAAVWWGSDHTCCPWTCLTIPGNTFKKKFCSTNTYSICWWWSMHIFCAAFHLIDLTCYSCNLHKLYVDVK